MYKLSRMDGFLMVEFEDSFDYGTIKHMLYNEIMIPGFCQLNDIWLVGNHRAHLRLGDLQTIVDDFHKLCPKDTRKKTAIVAEPGLTMAILQLLADGMEANLPIACRTFHTLEDAHEWFGAEASQVA